MKFVSGIFGLIALAFVVSFALSNRQNVAVAMWPIDGGLQEPLYLIGLAPLAFGLVIGGLWGWIGGVPHRRRAKRLSKELVSLNDKIGELQKTTNVQQEKATKPSFWRFKS
ncbi:MAG: lipopolysaccharide assembly protein LapA domain-containing protein [Alphaproteobacteria bacterium]|nr:lipopolysaccharide assembly protein LapA domain-containing protein [Alphaproteobacteria bacterium]